MTEVRAEEPHESEREDEGLPSRLGIAALFHDSAIYGGTRVLVKSLAFLLVPLYAHYLTPAEFGILELVLATVALVDVFINLPGALNRFYFERDDPAWRRQVITVYFAIEAAYPALLIGGLVLLAGPLTDTIVGPEAAAAFLVIALADLYLTNIVDLPMALCRLRRKPLRFSVYSLVRVVTQVVFAVLLVAVLHRGVEGIFVASLVAACVAFVVTFREYGRHLTRRISGDVARQMLSFAWPTVISGLSFYLLNFVDRFFVRYYHGLDANGLYGVAFRYAQIVFVGVLAFRLGWPQWHYSWLHTDRHPEIVARGANYYFFAIGMLATGVSLWILPVFHLIMPERYWGSTVAVPPLALSAVAGGAYTIFVVGFHVVRRMRATIPIVAAGGGLAVGLYFLLVPPFSFQGAAWATAAAMWTLALATLAAGQRVYPVPWDRRRLAGVVGLIVALALSALALDVWAPFRLSLPVRAALTAVYPLLLLAFGYFPRDDVAKARAAAASVLGRVRRR